MASGTEEWVPNFGNLPTQDKNAVHDHLLSEQAWVCVYCGRALEPDRSDSHIEHFRPQSRYNGVELPDLTLSYDNLFSSCGPRSLPSRKARSYPRCCGDAKGNWFDEDLHVSPSTPGCEQRFAYGSSGSVTAANENDLAVTEMIKRLALDDPSLRQQRSVLLQALEIDFLAAEPSDDALAAEISIWRSPTAGGQLLSFGHVAAVYLEAEMAARG